MAILADESFITADETCVTTDGGTVCDAAGKGATEVELKNIDFGIEVKNIDCEVRTL